MNRDEGSASLVTITLVGLLALLAVGLAAVGLLLAAAGRAQTAADAAALAAAPLTFYSFGSTNSPYGEAARYADLNRARLVGCGGCTVDRSWRPRTVEIEVAVDIELPGFGPLGVSALAAAEFVPAQLLGAP